MFSWLRRYYRNRERERVEERLKKYNIEAIKDICLKDLYSSLEEINNSTSRENAQEAVCRYRRILENFVFIFDRVYIGLNSNLIKAVYPETREMIEAEIVKARRYLTVAECYLSQDAFVVAAMKFQNENDSVSKEIVHKEKKREGKSNRKEPGMLERY